MVFYGELVLKLAVHLAHGICLFVGRCLGIMVSFGRAIGADLFLLIVVMVYGKRVTLQSFY